MTTITEQAAKRLDKGAFAHTRDARDTDSNRLSGMRHQLAEHFLPLLNMGLCVAFYQGDRACQNGAIALKHALHMLVGCQTAAMGAWCPPSRLTWRGRHPIVTTGNTWCHVRCKGVATFFGNPFRTV